MSTGMTTTVMLSSDAKEAIKSYNARQLGVSNWNDYFANQVTAGSSGYAQQTADSISSAYSNYLKNQMAMNHLNVSEGAKEDYGNELWNNYSSTYSGLMTNYLNNKADVQSEIYKQKTALEDSMETKAKDITKMNNLYYKWLSENEQFENYISSTDDNSRYGLKDSDSRLFYEEDIDPETGVSNGLKLSENGLNMNALLLSKGYEKTDDEGNKSISTFKDFLFDNLTEEEWDRINSDDTWGIFNSVMGGSKDLADIDEQAVNKGLDTYRITKFKDIYDDAASNINETASEYPISQNNLSSWSRNGKQYTQLSEYTPINSVKENPIRLVGKEHSIRQTDTALINRIKNKGYAKGNYGTYSYLNNGKKSKSIPYFYIDGNDIYRADKISINSKYHTAENLFKDVANDSMKNGDIIEKNGYFVYKSNDKFYYGTVTK